MITQQKNKFKMNDFGFWIFFFLGKQMIIIRDEFSISHLFYTLIRMTNNVFTFNTTTIFSFKKNLLT